MSLLSDLRYGARASEIATDKRGSNPLARTRHRRHDDDLQCGRYGAVEAAAICGT